MKRNYARGGLVWESTEVVEPPEHLDVKGDAVCAIVVVAQPDPVVSRKLGQLLVGDRPDVANPGKTKSPREIVNIGSSNLQRERVRLDAHSVSSTPDWIRSGTVGRHVRCD